MGVLAYLEQVFADADHYAKVKAAYAKDPRGRVRPEFDRTLEPIETAVVDGTPFLMPANLGREIDRVLVLQKKLGVAPIVYGGQGAYARAEVLRTAKVPVLVNLNWPKEEKNRDPEAETPFRTLVHRRMAPTTPAALAAAGVPFAFYSGGLASTSEVFESVRAATENGLSNEAALAALSANAAAILGVSDRLGTIEKGKIANLVLATDWPWADGAEVRAVFVDGRLYQERTDEGPSDPPVMDVGGTWAVSMNTPRGTREMTLDITMSKDGKVKGKMTSDRGESVLDDGRMSGEVLRFKTTREVDGRSITSSWTLNVAGEKVSGTMSAGSMQADVTGARTKKAEAEAVAKKGDGKQDVPIEDLRGGVATYQGAAKKMGTFAITNANVWTVSGRTIENGTVVVSQGKIRAVGSDVKIPKGAEIIDAKGGSLIPGIIDCHSHIAIEGGVNEGTLAVTAMVEIADVINPDDVGIYRALAGGVTSANLLHGSANPIGGQNQVIKLRWGKDAEGLKFQGAPAGIKFALGENPKRSNFNASAVGVPQRYPQTRMGVMDVIREAFTEAREYQREWAVYKAGARNGVKPTLPRRDLEMEALVEILEGKRMVHSHCYRADEILQLLRLAEEFGFRVATLQHVLEGYRVADEIAEHGAGASTFSDWWGYKVEAYEAIPHNAALMTERGVVVSINSDSGEEMRHLNQEAAKAVKWGGMNEVDALKMVTLNPAKQLGIDSRVGSIEVGKDADLVLYNGHPLSTHSVVQKTFVDGDLYFDLAWDQTREATIAALKERMAGKSKTSDGKETGAGAGANSAPSPEVRWADEPYSCAEDHE
jgi:imidazolonepropionase-like amidohydrolase